MDGLEERLRQLVKEACKHQPGSAERQKILTKIIRLISHKLWKEISQLQPPEDLIDRLHQLMHVAPTASVVATSRSLVNLSQWFQDVFETGWQTVETLLNPSQSNLSFSFRSADSDLAVAVDDSDAGVRRAKLIDLGMQLSRHLVTLIVEIRPESEQKNNILLQMHPAGSQTYLPPLLQLTVLDEYGATFLEAVARSADNYIQLKFSGEPGERFSVKVAFGDSSITEDFVI